VSQFRQTATPWSVPARQSVIRGQSVIRLAPRVSVSATSPNGADGVNDVPRSKPSGIGARTEFWHPHTPPTWTSRPASTTTASGAHTLCSTRRGRGDGEATKDVFAVPAPTWCTGDRCGALARGLCRRVSGLALAGAEMSRDPATAERARLILNELIRQRQGLRDAGADEGLLEANRLGIVYWQWQLTRALGAARQKSEAAA
jgi:hypothetical protein